MVLIERNTKLLERKHFLIRAMHNGNVGESEGQNEINQIDKEVSKNLLEELDLAKEKLSQEVQEIKQLIKTDGDMKRNVASALIKFLETQGFPNDEIKGIFRQGYKISRYK